MSGVTVRNLTEDRSCEAILITGKQGLRPNRALIDALTLTHRFLYELIVTEDMPEPDLSPEAKLLRAIFGESAEKAMIPPVGTVLGRNDSIITRHPFGSRNFLEGFRGEIEDVKEEMGDLPDGMKERYRITVKSTGPLTVGDVLLANGETLGVIDGIEDDGASEPHLYIASYASRAARITRKLPTAIERMTARSIGRYDDLTQMPIDGREIRLDQLEWLVEAGGREIVSEIATYTTNDVMRRTRGYEALVKQEALDEAGRRGE